jgi:serine/threonine-protein kinase
MSRRRFREAVDQSRRAIELDPLSFATSNDLGVILYAARRYREAAEHARHSLSLAPQSEYPRFLLGVALTAQGNHTESIAELESLARKLERPPAVLGRLGYGYARAGRKSDAQAILQELMRNGDAARIYLAMVQTGLGDHDSALQSLEASAARRETDFLFIGADPIFDPLHSYARFGALCGRLGLP